MIIDNTWIRKWHIISVINQRENKLKCLFVIVRCLQVIRPVSKLVMLLLACCQISLSVDTSLTLNVLNHSQWIKHTGEQRQQLSVKCNTFIHLITIIIVVSYNVSCYLLWTRTVSFSMYTVLLRHMFRVRIILCYIIMITFTLKQMCISCLHFCSAQYVL